MICSKKKEKEGGWASKNWRGSWRMMLNPDVIAS
jgi:hypothetical protein